jgi:hypothetical protein
MSPAFPSTVQARLFEMMGKGIEAPSGSLLGKKVGEKLHQKLSMEMRWVIRRNSIRSFPGGCEAPSRAF